MKINSKKLFEFVNNLGTDEKVEFKVYLDDIYVTDIKWDGENFIWESGTFSSGMLFDPLVDFEEIVEETKKIKKIRRDICWIYADDRYKNCYKLKPKDTLILNKLDELIDRVNAIGGSDD